MVHPTIYLKLKTIQYPFGILKPSRETFALSLLVQPSPSWTRLRPSEGSTLLTLGPNYQNKRVTIRFELCLGNKHHLKQSQVGNVLAIQAAFPSLAGQGLASPWDCVKLEGFSK